MFAAGLSGPAKRELSPVGTESALQHEAPVPPFPLPAGAVLNVTNAYMLVHVNTSIIHYYYLASNALKHYTELLLI